MFKRIIYENWTDGMPQIAFWLTFSVFLAITARALLIKKSHIEHMENLPFQDEPGQDKPKPNRSQK